ncbi:MAG: nucleotide sugar dehydrogenase, partial [Calditerricola sp.]|nr:nucleotide sugar dehydrogenase [Calditerricola sp.]
TFELIRVANTHKRVNLLLPGPGVGGYCLPNALYYLLPKARELGVGVELLELARRINDGVPNVLVNMLDEALRDEGKTLAGSRVAVFGLAMKDYSNDDRISPAHTVVRLLQEAGAEVRAYDPVVPASYPFKVDSAEQAVEGADALALLTVQKPFAHLDWTSLVAKMNGRPVLLDAKNHLPKALAARARLIRI